jgi:ParB family chromosome partitioning protein
MRTKRKQFSISQTLSKGLEETISIVENDDGLYRGATIPMSRITLDPDNPRKLNINIEDVINGLSQEDQNYEKKLTELDGVIELSESIKKSGLINPIIVYKRINNSYMVIAGERRFLACTYLKKSEIEARILENKPSDLDIKLVQWFENTEREDLSLHEKLLNLKDLCTLYTASNSPDITPILIRKISGFSKAQASCYSSIINATNDVWSAIADGKINNLEKAAIIASCPTDSNRIHAIELCASGATTAQLKAYLAKISTLSQVDNTKPTTKIQNNPIIQKTGRKKTRVNMGHVEDTRIVKRIITAVLSLPELKSREKEKNFTNIDWGDFDQVTDAFSSLLELLKIELGETE